MSIKNRLLYVLVLLFFTFSLVAQENDSIPASQEELENILTNEIPNDTTEMDMKGVEQMELMDSEVDPQDNPLVYSADSKASEYHLKDHPLAAKYDSLWMKELYENAALFDEMYEEVVTSDYDKEEETEEAYVYDLPTDTLKARLAKMNQKTPFNIAYNPSLENVIKSFLTRKRNLMERMLTVSQFYFPLFEQQLDNHDIPLEMKYLSIVESALNPRARSRVGATGLWQFMYGTGKDV